jgi:hypothetical protein
MSQPAMRVGAVMLLQHHHVRRRVLVSVPLPPEPAVPQPWYRRWWTWLVDRYHLTGWEP